MFHLLQFASVFHYNIVTKSRKKLQRGLHACICKGRERERIGKGKGKTGEKRVFSQHVSCWRSSIPLVIRDPQRTRESRENVCIRIVLPSIAPTPRLSPSIFLRCVNVICPLKHLLYDYSSLKGSSTAFQHFYPPERGHNRFLYLDPRG